MQKIDEGDIIIFAHSASNKTRPAVILEPHRINKYKNTLNGVIATTQKVDVIYPFDYPLPDGILEKPSKIICDQPTLIPKSSVFKKVGKLESKDLNEIRKRTAASLGITFSESTQ